ncbi:hypothetical protein AMECASPLE_014375 [Ameca splendens]|uniref:Uncharacterized protein n=1 Tax=Ameca splendens TaxID=208324 RepID=A0ABV0Y1G5_9TELE
MTEYHQTPPCLKNAVKAQGLCCAVCLAVFIIGPCQQCPVQLKCKNDTTSAHSRPDKRIPGKTLANGVRGGRDFSFTPAKAGV